jgi:histidyl-tRNA synthetase
LGGGGRYDDLVSTLGGNNIPALGFAFELEKLLQVETNQPLELKAEIDSNKEETIA